MYDQLKTLVEKRKTPRLVETDDISEENIQKILDIAKLAPSLDQNYGYKIHALTNSTAGIEKKEALLKYYRCMNGDGTHPQVTDPFSDREMIQPILSGLSLVFVVTPKRAVTMKTSDMATLICCIRDAMISATYAMMAAESLGFKAGMFGNVDHNGLEYNPSAPALFSDAPGARIILTVTVANKLVSIPEVDEKGRHWFDYKGERPYVLPHKHQQKTVMPEVIMT
jgi:nitroreductase